MRRIIRAAIILLVLVFAAIQFVRPPRTNPVTNPTETLAAHAIIPPDAQAILDRACRDCHSNETRWPWYSTVAPVSWFVIDHVDHGRTHFNYSQWGTYDRARQRELLEASCTMARSGAMPIGSYLLMHSSARLTSADVAALCRWTQTALR